MLKRGAAISVGVKTGHQERLVNTLYPDVFVQDMLGQLENWGSNVKYRLWSDWDV